MRKIVSVCVLAFAFLFVFNTNAFAKDKLGTGTIPQVRTGKQSSVSISVGKRSLSQFASNLSLKVTKNKKKKDVKKSLTLSWKKVKEADLDKFQVQYSTSSKFKNGTITSQDVPKNKTSVVLNKLKSNKKYYVRMRAVYKMKLGSSNSKNSSSSFVINEKTSWSKTLNKKTK